MATLNRKLHRRLTNNVVESIADQKEQPLQITTYKVCFTSKSTPWHPNALNVFRKACGDCNKVSVFLFVSFEKREKRTPCHRLSKYIQPMHLTLTCQCQDITNATQQTCQMSTFHTSSVVHFMINPASSMGTQ